MQGWKKTALISASFLLIAAMVLVWLLVDLGTADGLASVVGACAGVAGLAYAMLGGQQNDPVVHAANTGTATARNQGQANTGITGPATRLDGQMQAEHTGDADADGGTANTGIQLT
ncbi:hypothetical protein ACFVYE_43065 [Streptomyces sp. NPDC058239]|uniref:hypothetical protein n=1 Tax=Streptomyces sp. NPDC058239 TaxID=3346395 RepID=UPI0036E6D721